MTRRFVALSSRAERGICISIALLLILSSSASAQSLRDAIIQIRAIDDHAHVPVSATDRGYDALPCDAPSVAVAPFMFRAERPDVREALQALYGTSDMQQAMATKQRLRAERGANWFTRVLDQANTETQFANRITPAAELAAPRFRWVPYDDALLFPLDNANEKAVNGDRQVFYKHEEDLLADYMKATGVSALPPTLADYIARVLKPTLAAQKRAGAVALKFEMAYLRTLQFDPASATEAARVYEQYLHTAPPRIEYKKLQDYLFRALAVEAGRLRLPIQIHTGAGCGDWFQLAGSDPLLLDSLVSEPAMQQTQFVILHGGWPFSDHVAPMMIKPNVWGEFSVQALLRSPHALAETLRVWLESQPQKLLYGTDSGPAEGNYTWEETLWVANRRARAALTAALDAMVADGELSRDEALSIARGVLRENAIKLYGLQ